MEEKPMGRISQITKDKMEIFAWTVSAFGRKMWYFSISYCDRSHRTPERDTTSPRLSELGSINNREEAKILTNVLLKTRFKRWLTCHKRWISHERKGGRTKKNEKYRQRKDTTEYTNHEHKPKPGTFVTQDKTTSRSVSGQQTCNPPSRNGLLKY